ncbi:MAG: POTRA domain-containing protein [Bacteroidota bacterium]
MIQLQKILLKTFFLAILLLNSASAQYSQHDSSEIYITETDIITDGELSSLPLLKLLQTQSNRTYDPEILLKNISRDSTAILDFSRSEGFHFAEVSVKRIKENSSENIHFILHEKRRVLLDSITILLKENISNEPFKSITEDYRGEIYNEENFQNLLKEIVTEVEKNGFPYAAAQVENVSIDTAFKASVIISLNAGPQALLKEVKIEGNSETDSAIISRLAAIPFGEYYTPRTSEAVGRRLRRSGIFSSVENPGPYLDENGNAGLLLKVTEGAQNTIDGILGYSSAQNQTKGGISGFLNIQFRNLFGTARRFNFRFLKDQTESQEIEAGYLEPIFFSLPFSLGADYFLRQQDSTFSRSKITIYSGFNLSDFLYGTVFGFYNSISPASINTLGFTVFKTSELGLKAEISYDSRDNFINPTDGVFYSANISTSRKNILGPQQFIDSLKPQLVTQRRTTELRASLFLPVLKRQTAVFHANFLQIDGEELEESELLRIGGRTTFRGYAENQFLTNQALWGGLEYRLLLSEKSFVGAFFDGGNLASPDFLKRFSVNYPKFLFGYGINGQIETPLGLILLTIGLGRGDSFQQAKVSVGLRTDF